MRTTWRVLPVVALVAVVAVLLGGSVVLLGFISAANPSNLRYPLVIGGAWLAFAGAIVLLRRVPTRAASALVLAGAVVIGGAAMAGPPNTSTDSARYAWDGIVQTHGISPYAYAPTDPALKDLRPAWLFPAPVRAPDGSLECRGPRIQTFREVGSTAIVCTALNRGMARTIYPPAAELVFAAVRLVVGTDAHYWPMQLLGLLLSLGVTAVLIRALRRRDLDVRWAALWAWCPLVATEAVTNSHVDVIGALLLLVATLASASGSRWRSGLALGAAISTKLVPAIGVPAIIARRGAWWTLAVAAGLFALLYVPYVIASGVNVLGYLPGYLTEEGYGDGSRFVLLAPLSAPGLPSALDPLHGGAPLVVAVAIVVVTAVLVWRKTDAHSPFLGQVVMIGITLIVVSPRYPWYALLLIPMIAMTGRAEWLLVALALTVRQLYPHYSAFEVALCIAIATVALGAILRSGPGWLGRTARELRHPLRRPRSLSPSVGA